MGNVWNNSLLVRFVTSRVLYDEAMALVQWLKLPAWKVWDRGLETNFGFRISKKQHVSSQLKRKYVRGSANDRYRARPQTTGARISHLFVWRAVSSHLYHQPQEVFLSHFSLCMHKGGLINLIYFIILTGHIYVYFTSTGILWLSTEITQLEIHWIVYFPIHVYITPCYPSYKWYIGIIRHLCSIIPFIFI